MNNFTRLINEVRKNYDSGSLLSSEISQYINKVNNKIPKFVQHVIYLTQKYNLLDAKNIDEIRLANKGSLSNLVKKYNIPDEELQTLWKLLKELKNNIRLLPQYQTPQEREAIQLGKISMNDLVVDLTTPTGRNEATKMYMPMIYKIVNQYAGKSRMSKQELISAALQGFTDAMNNWDNSSDKKHVTFKTYAAYRVQQQILNDINAYSHSLSGTNWYAAKNFSSYLDAVSLDGMPTNDEGEFKNDYLAALGETDKTVASNEEHYWEELYQLIENTFKQRDIDIFYRYFGLHGYKREKSKDIAKSMGMSEGNIRNSIINKIIKFLQKNNKAIRILSDIQDMYNESLMMELVGFSKDEILETLINDDIFILLEELNKWNNKSVFGNALKNSLKYVENIEAIVNILLGDFDYLDANYKKYKKDIIRFLSHMHPTLSFNSKTDIDIFELVGDIQEYIKTHNIKHENLL